MGVTAAGQAFTIELTVIAGLNTLLCDIIAQACTSQNDSRDEL